ncbi:MAG: hypothetical protein EXS55_00050 [Candidatus Magasanikbacteria bacterium]|nr:hypothetical protein [Candidatus Magasanikbacteria bacterium]
MPFGIHRNGKSALTPEHIQHLTSELPDPLYTYRWGQVHFVLYEAKEFHVSNWLHPHWPALVSEARRSYLRYGAVPLLDSYDDKAAVYLCRVDYPATDEEGVVTYHTEWVSTRFIPANGTPLSTEDLDQYHFLGKSVGQHLAEEVGESEGVFWKNVMTISRICGFAHYNSKGLIGNRSTRLKYSAVAFLLMNYYVFHHATTRDLTFVTAVFSERLFNKISMEIQRETNVQLTVPGIEVHFKCTPEEIMLERKVMAYRFPGYFLNMHELARLLKRLYHEGKMTAQSFCHFLENFVEHEIEQWEESSHRDLLNHLRGLGRLLTAHGQIPGATLTGKQLRALVDAEVGDGPLLRFIDAPGWRAQLDAAVAALDLK